MTSGSDAKRLRRGIAAFSVAFIAVVAGVISSLFPTSANAAGWVTFLDSWNGNVQQLSDYYINDNRNPDGSIGVTVRTALYHHGSKGYVSWGSDKDLYVDGRLVHTIVSDRNAKAYAGSHITQQGSFNVYGGGSHHVTSVERPFQGIIVQAGWDFWITLPYRVTFKAGYGSNATLSDQNVMPGGNASAPSPSRPGYDFVGWDKPTTNIQGDTVITAQWRKKTYTVTFKAGYGSNATLKTETVEHGGNATAPSVPTRDSHTFTGWDRGFTNVTSNITVTAQWKIKVYDVVFKSGFGDNAVLKTERVEHGSAAHAPSVPKRTGYTHTGWDKRFDTITSNLTVTATWRAHTYTVKFHANGRGSSGSTPDLQCTYDVAANLTKNGFERHEDVGGGRTQHWRFLGWSRTPTGNVELADQERVINMTAEDGGVIDLYAVWEKVNGWGDANKAPEAAPWL